jgi:hypothetical protein
VAGQRPSAVHSRHGVADADGSRLYDVEVYADAGEPAEVENGYAVSARDGAHDLGVGREVAVAEGGDHASGCGHQGTQEGFTDAQMDTDPGVFGEARFVRGVDDEVGAEAARVEVAGGVGRAQSCQRSRGDEVEGAVVEEASRCRTLTIAGPSALPLAMIASPSPVVSLNRAQ